MNVTKVCLGGLVATLLGLGQASAQMPADTSTNGSGAAIPAPGPAAFAQARRIAALQDHCPKASPQGYRAGCSINGPPAAAGPSAAMAPSAAKSTWRSGVSLPIGGGFLNNVLSPGWDIEGGVRTLFFNPALDSAWVVDVGITNIFNNASDKSSHVSLLNVSSTVNGTTSTIPSVPVSVASLNRTFFNLAGGKEWYLSGTADPHANASIFKVGVDGGGRWGSEKIELNELTHRTDVTGGVFAAVHADYEVPCGAWQFMAGLRAEWAYTWSDILQHQNRTDNQDLNLMLTAGVRF